jgi:serine/threonine protein kinase
MATFFEQFRDFLAPRFQLEQELGSGGMGAVYLARDTELLRFVAVKVLPPEKASAAAAERFLREARILADLQHPNIVRIYDVGRDTDPFIYYIMEHLSGATLADRLKQGELSPQETTKLARDLLDALGQAHAHGVIHRDIKPSNIFWVDGRGVLADFGVAKSRASGSPVISEPGEPRGTLEYMSPEQLAGEAIPQSDLYALGMVLYESLSGRHWKMEARRSGPTGRVCRWRCAPRCAARWRSHPRTAGPTRRRSSERCGGGAACVEHGWARSLWRRSRSACCWFRGSSAVHLPYRTSMCASAPSWSRAGWASLRWGTRCRLASPSC